MLEISGVGSPVGSRARRKRALELIRLDWHYCWFEVNGNQVDVLDETDEQKILAVSGKVFFYVPPTFRDLLIWVETNQMPENLEQRKNDLYYMSRACWNEERSRSRWYRREERRILTIIEKL